MLLLCARPKYFAWLVDQVDQVAAISHPLPQVPVVPGGSGPPEMLFYEMKSMVFTIHCSIV